MCRFAMYLGPPIQLSALVTEPSNSIIHQSYDAKERAEPLNGDGFGVAWYVPELREEPAVFKSVSPAWNNANLLNIAPVTRSSCLLAHVRAATPGLPVTQLNCHPFVRRRLAFMHNGSVGGFSRMRRQLQGELSDEAFTALEGTTDSEHVLALLGDRWQTSERLDPQRRSVEALLRTIDELEQLRRAVAPEEPSYLNLALTDGRVAMACRYISPNFGPGHSLYYARGRLVIEGGEGRVVEAAASEAAVIVASEPLGDRGRWLAVPDNHLLLIDEARNVAMEAIPSPACATPP